MKVSKHSEPVWHRPVVPLRRRPHSTFYRQKEQGQAGPSLKNKKVTDTSRKENRGKR